MNKIILTLMLTITLISYGFASTETSSSSQDFAYTEANENQLRKETIKKGNSTLTCSYNENTLSYGQNSIVDLEIHYPVNLAPSIRLNSQGMEYAVENGQVLDILEGNPVMQEDGSVSVKIEIVFEAFLPGTVRINSFAIDMFSTGNGSAPQFTFNVQAISFEFAGDPSLVSIEGSDNSEAGGRELAELITTKESSGPTLLIIIISAALVILLPILFIFLKKKKTVIETLSDEENILKLLEKSRQNYYEQLDDKNLRPAYGNLRKIIQLSPELSDRPKMKEKYMNECNEIYFSGRTISGETAKQHIKNLFLKITEESKE